MPVENEAISVANRRFFCVDPRDGAAVFEFAKPRKAGLIQPSDERETICVGTLPVDPEARPLLERLECELQIDHDYVAQATLRSLGRQEATQVEFHQLEFGLSLPSPSGSRGSSEPVKNEAQPGGSERDRTRSLSPATAPFSNVTLRSNLTPKGDDWRLTLGDWWAVPGDLIERWRTDFFGPRFNEMSTMQLDERNYYVPCSRCARTLYFIQSQGPNEICRRYRCSEFRNRGASPSTRSKS